MIAAIIFGLHGILLLGALAFRWKRAGAVEGILAAAFVIIIFSVGWTLATMVTRLVVPAEGFTRWMDADTIALLLVTALEIVFYGLLLRGMSLRRTAARGADGSTSEDKNGFTGA